VQQAVVVVIVAASEQQTTTWLKMLNSAFVIKNNKHNKGRQE
jgi:hypothetical protein